MKAFGVLLFLFSAVVLKNLKLNMYLLGLSYLPDYIYNLSIISNLK